MVGAERRLQVLRRQTQSGAARFHSKMYTKHDPIAGHRGDHSLMIHRHIWREQVSYACFPCGWRHLIYARRSSLHSQYHLTYSTHTPPIPPNGMARIKTKVSSTASESTDLFAEESEQLTQSTQNSSDKHMWQTLDDTEEKLDKELHPFIYVLSSWVGDTSPS